MFSQQVKNTKNRSSFSVLEIIFIITLFYVLSVLRFSFKYDIIVVLNLNYFLGTFMITRILVSIQCYGHSPTPFLCGFASPLIFVRTAYLFQINYGALTSIIWFSFPIRLACSISIINLVEQRWIDLTSFCLKGESGEDLSPVSSDWLPDLSAGQRTSVCSTGSEDTTPSPITRQLSGSKSTWVSLWTTGC